MGTDGTAGAPVYGSIYLAVERTRKECDKHAPPEYACQTVRSTMDERIFRVERFRNGFNCRTPSGTCYPAEYENKLQSMKTITIPVPSLDDGDAVLKQIVVNLAKTNEQGTGNTLGTGTLNVTPGHNTYTFPGDGQASVTITRTTR